MNSAIFGSPKAEPEKPKLTKSASTQRAVYATKLHEGWVAVQPSVIDEP